MTSLCFSSFEFVCLGLLGYWSFVLISPFLTTIVWSVIITVALYPVFGWLSAKLYGHRALAAIAITVFMFFVLLGPVTWLAVSLAETVRALLARFGDGVWRFSSFRSGKSLAPHWRKNL